MKTLRYEVLGDEGYVYPGHPITVAYLIVHRYPSLEAALAKPGNQWNDSYALADSEIPGAGGNVHDALEFLAHLKEGMCWSRAVQLADENWATCDSQKQGGYVPGKTCPAERQRRKTHLKQRWQKGQDQADKIKPLFRALSAWWAA